MSEALPPAVSSGTIRSSESPTLVIQLGEWGGLSIEDTKLAHAALLAIAGILYEFGHIKMAEHIGYLSQGLEEYL